MEFIEQIEEIANAKPTTENELEKANKLIQEEKADRETKFANELQLLCEKYKVTLSITQPQITVTAL